MNSPLWRAALDRYRAQIKEDKDYHIVMETNSVEDLLKEAEAMNSVFGNRSTTDLVQRLKPTLMLVDSFSAALALCFGADAKFTIIAWGSIRLILSMASSRADIVSKIIAMLEELSSTLPKFKTYEDCQFVNPSLEDALIAVYTDVICFYARCIRFFRSESGFLGRPLAWENLHNDFFTTINSIRILTSIIDSQAELSRTQMSKEVLEVMASMKKANINNSDVMSTQNLPENLATKFWGRDDILAIIDKALEPQTKPHKLKSFALYGLGGVGKTKIAHQFSELNKDNYQDILWIASDNFITMSQSFSQVEVLLWPDAERNERQDASSAILKVKNWLQRTGEYLF